LKLIPKKRFGQHFLVQASAIRAITEAALAAGAPQLLEIGPGPGVLTGPLLADGRPLWAVELDPDAVAVLEQRFRGVAHFHPVQGDAVQVPLDLAGPLSVVGNLPYNAATAILTRFLVADIPWERMVFMFQLEVGRKLLGRPGEKDYGPLSVLAQLCCRLTRLLKLGPGAFRPPPKVDSAVLLFEPRPGAPALGQRQALLALLHTSFAHRRKTLANNWHGLFAPERGQEILAEAGLPAAIRAEAVPPDVWPILFQLTRSSAPPEPVSI
jgi:16S rRNA (adenine1518-N6/adenine1519-N6)-dimethyltransferase